MTAMTSQSTGARTLLQCLAAGATALALGCTTTDAPSKTATQQQQFASASVAYIFEFGAGINDPAGPGTGSSIFRNAVTGGAIGSGDTGTYKGTAFTNLPIATLDANPSTGLAGFDTAILYQICHIAEHPTALAAVNAFLDSGHKVMIFDADGCAEEELGHADYSGFLFPFATDSPGPQGASGTLTFVEPSTLTTGLTVGTGAGTGDALGDANVFTSNAGGWCESLGTRNTDGVEGFVEAYARTLNGGLALYNGEDFWFTFGQNDHLTQVFDLMLQQPFAPDGLPCSRPASGIKLDPPTQTDNVGSPATVIASVFDQDGNPAAGATVTFAVESGPDAGTTGTAVADAAGHASFTYTNTTSIGTDSVGASFTDTLTHHSNVVTVNWVAQPTTLVYTGDTTQDFDDPATLAATLITSSGPAPGQTLTLTLGAQSCSAVTDATGRGACTVVPNLAAGTYTVTASFAGTPSLLASTASATFTVTLEETTIQYTGDTLIAEGGVAHLSGTLLEDGASPIAGRTVTLTLGSGATAQSCAAVTDAAGHAACDIQPVAQPLGPGVATAAFAGDGFYLPATASKPTLVFAFLDHGSFVIGDGNAAVGTAVTFWGAQWWKDNVVSVTGGPASFKGFAENGSATCGATWSTDPGNSSGPPATVPSFMAVIVSDSITKSGSTISGDTPKVVIVQTDPGYADNPGHAGTGTVVATLCGK